MVQDLLKLNLESVFACKKNSAKVRSRRMGKNVKDGVIYYSGKLTIAHFF